jgi:hypothetical protein
MQGSAIEQELELSQMIPHRGQELAILPRNSVLDIRSATHGAQRVVQSAKPSAANTFLTSSVQCNSMHRIHYPHL